MKAFAWEAVPASSSRRSALTGSTASTLSSSLRPSQVRTRSFAKEYSFQFYCSSLSLPNSLVFPLPLLKTFSLSHTHSYTKHTLTHTLAQTALIYYFILFLASFCGGVFGIDGATSSTAALTSKFRQSATQNMI